MTPAEQAEKIISLAAQHVDGAIFKASALLCLTDARELLRREDYFAARCRAMKSLAYSVGVFHADYKQATVIHQSN